MKKFIKNIKDTYTATKLCIKYPFLYPRNRFTDQHYNWWWLIDKQRDLIKYRKYYFNTSEDKDTYTGRKYYLKKTTFKDSERYMITYWTNPWASPLYKLADFIEKYIVQLIHIFPNYTELDALDTGWRIRFGMDICEEIKQSLLHTFINNEKPNTWYKKFYCYLKGIKLLHKYRIEQIKEKFGGLRWYTNFGTKEVYDIVDKYEELSFHTCIICGKEATHMSTGWICPYCEEHKPEHSVPIDK